MFSYLILISPFLNLNASLDAFKCSDSQRSLSSRKKFLRPNNKNSDLVFFGVAVLIDHDVDLAVQFVEHNVDVVKHGVGVVGIVEVCVAFCGRWGRHPTAGAAKRNGRRGRRVRGRRGRRRSWLRQVAVELTLLYRPSMLVGEWNLVNRVDRRIGLKLLVKV